MSVFTALNVETDTDTEDEVDYTRELQIEEALKLYQNALKLQSQGPQSFRECEEAYQALFKSEIFSYPEASGWSRRALQSEYPGPETGSDDDTDGELASEAVDSHVLLQTVSLAYKNRGQFILDKLRSSLATLPDDAARSGAHEQVVEAIRLFTEALDRDESDIDLWRRTAKLAMHSRSDRVSRFCLESITDTDVATDTEERGALTLERTIAEHELRNALQRLCDDASLTLTDCRQPHRLLGRLLEQRADPYPFLGRLLTPRHSARLANAAIERCVLQLETRSWASLGVEILEAMRKQSESSREQPFGSVSIILPDDAMDLTPAASPTHGQDLMNEPPEKAADPTATEPAIPRIDADETSTLNAAASKVALPSVGEPASTTAPSLKRALVSIDDQEETGRFKSKRLRARETQHDANSGDTAQNPQAQYLEDLLESYKAADEALYSAVNDILEELGWAQLGSSCETRDQWGRLLLQDSQTQSHLQVPTDLALPMALRVSMRRWDENKSKACASIFGLTGSSHKQSAGSDALFDEGAKRQALTILANVAATKQPAKCLSAPVSPNSLTDFVAEVGHAQLSISTVAFQWLQRLLGAENCSYVTEPWSQDLSNTVKAMISEYDAPISAHMHSLASDIDKLGSSNGALPGSAAFSMPDLSSLAHMAQSLFELHLGIAAEGQAQDDLETAMLRNRVVRWGSLSFLFIQHQTNLTPTAASMSLRLRHLWAHTIHQQLVGDYDSSHIQSSLCEFKQTLLSLGSPVVRLPNSAIAPEISVAAIEQEVSRRCCLEFFAGILAPNDNDPERVIPQLALLLDPSSVEVVDTTEAHGGVLRQYEEAARLLDAAGIDVQLYLWDRLKAAYAAIENDSAAAYCCLRQAELIMSQTLLSGSRVEHATLCNSDTILRALNTLCLILSELRTRLLNATEAILTCFTLDRLKAGSELLVRLSAFLYTFTVTEDAQRVGLLPTLDVRPASQAKHLADFNERVRGLVVDCWTIHYLLLKCALTETGGSETSDALRLQYLRACHGFLGLRFYCKYGDKAFLRLMIREVSMLPHGTDYEYEMAQLYFDLFGLKFGAGLDVIVDHHCPFGPLDVPTAVSIADFIMMQAQRLSVKDLPKSELKAAIDTVQISIGSLSKASPALALGRRIIKDFLRSPIDRRALLECFDGIGDVSIGRANVFSTKLAQNGWFSLLGQSALMKFRSQRRLTATSTEDLDTALKSFRHELEHGFGDWQTWYFLAQSYDLKIDEEIQWSSEKFDKREGRLVEYELSAIHAYTMAVAKMRRTVDLPSHISKTISDLYADFAGRLYASSREPLAMRAFRQSQAERPYATTSLTMYAASSRPKMRTGDVWVIAARLMREAFSAHTCEWKRYYTYSKILWKLYTDDSDDQPSKRPQLSEVLEALVDTIQALPHRKDSRAEPILEPHYKLVTIVHKLVARGDLSASQGYERMQATRFAHKIPPPAEDSRWKDYVLEVLRRLRSADKSSWHHRIPMRAAHVMYDGAQDAAAATAAKAELTLHLFRKNAGPQVWRPESERAGRHFVYTTRCVRFFVTLLDRLDDKENMEQLAKRVRKKPYEFADHAGLWEWLCRTYTTVGLNRWPNHS
ncbi:Histone transcription regulator 3 [Ascosphaera acerosa]|nr:Histone transcription regulator 3 [Ascosphaera acerosa]